MNKKKLNIAIHSAHVEDGGIYNVLGSFAQGLLAGFRQLGISSFPTLDYVKAQKKFDMAIGFNVSSYEAWGKIMDNNIYNVMWTVDSIFAQNFKIINHYKDNPKFIVFTVREDDISLTKKLMPGLQIVYIPHATNPNLWKQTEINNNKDFDIILTSSVCDYEKQLNDFLDSLSNEQRHTAKEMYEILINNPQMKFYEIYEKFCKDDKLNFSAEAYFALYNVYLPIIESAFKVKTVKKLKDFPLKIFGNEVWTKYISGKQKYMGTVDVKESIEVVNRAKICLHPHVSIYGGGLHERFLNSAIMRTFVLCSSDLTIKNNFGDSFGYFDCENIAEQTAYYLQNDDIRKSMQDKAYEITKNQHCWVNRAKQILDLCHV